MQDLTIACKAAIAQRPRLALLKSSPTSRLKTSYTYRPLHCFLNAMHCLKMCHQTFAVPSTSKTQYWGQGKAHDKDPKPIYTEQYGKKRRTDRYKEFDPRKTIPEASLKEQNEALLHNYQSQEEESIFEYIISFEYKDYPLDFERKIVQSIMCQKFQGCHARSAMSNVDPMSNSSAYN